MWSVTSNQYWWWSCRTVVIVCVLSLRSSHLQFSRVTIYISFFTTVRVADIDLVPDIAEPGGWWGHWLHPRRLCIEAQRSATILSHPGHCSWGDRTQELWVADRRWHIFSDQVITLLDWQQYWTPFDSGTASTFVGTWHFAQLAEICNRTWNDMNPFL